MKTFRNLMLHAHGFHCSRLHCIAINLSIVMLTRRIVLLTNRMLPCMHAGRASARLPNMHRHACRSFIARHTQTCFSSLKSKCILFSLSARQRAHKTVSCHILSKYPTLPGTSRGRCPYKLVAQIPSRHSAFFALTRFVLRNRMSRIA